MTHYTTGAAVYGYNNTLRQGFRTCNVHKLYMETKDVVVENSAGNYFLIPKL